MRSSLLRPFLFGAALSGGLGCGPTTSCVARGARVRTPRGLRFIETLEVGEALYAFDLDAKALVPTSLVAIRQAARECVGLELPGISLTLTSDHPLYCPQTRSWAPAGDWALGQRTHLLRVTEHGAEPAVVTARLLAAGVFEVFDLTVEHPAHNFVANDVLVHNKSIAASCFLEDGGRVYQYNNCTCADGGRGAWDCSWEDPARLAVCGSCNKDGGQ